MGMGMDVSVDVNMDVDMDMDMLLGEVVGAVGMVGVVGMVGIVGMVDVVGNRDGVQHMETRGSKVACSWACWGWLGCIGREWGAGSIVDDGAAVVAQGVKRGVVDEAVVLWIDLVESAIVLVL